MELSISNTENGYTSSEIKQIIENLSDRMSLATRLIISAGLRPCELHTLEKRNNGMYVVYTHDSKASRRVNVLPSLDAELTLYKRTKPVVQLSNKKRYMSCYNLPAGQHWHKRFNHVAIQVIGKSYSIKTLRSLYAINRWEYWYKSNTDAQTANYLIDLELGIGITLNKHRQWRKECVDSTYFDYESACENEISEQITGSLLTGQQTLNCFSCANLFYIAKQKGIPLSLENILNQSAPLALDAIKYFQWQYDFAKYNFNMVNADSCTTERQKAIAAHDLDISCLLLMKKLETSKEYLLEKSHYEIGFNVPFINNANLRERTY